MIHKQLGQFYTHKNIFNHPLFLEWFDNIPLEYRQNILEPFAGSNGIIKMLKRLNRVVDFTSYDIMPTDKEVQYRDTLREFPQGFDVIVTNPPFLAKNSATRHKLVVDINPFSDLYEYCLDICLKNTKYLAVIIPESFITNPNFDKSRLFAIISLQEKNIFKDTEHPVCLALFTPETQSDFLIYHNKFLIGSFKDLKERENKLLEYSDSHDYQILWHNPAGQIGLTVIDATDRRKQISFIKGDLINPEEVNLLSRLRTRILILDKKGKPLKKRESNALIKELNEFFQLYREETFDVFLTAFKGLRTDERYRRRLDFTKGRLILDACLTKVCYNQDK